jgi:hypothetical protein
MFITLLVMASFQRLSNLGRRRDRQNACRPRRADCDTSVSQFCMSFFVIQTSFQGIGCTNRELGTEQLLPYGKTISPASPPNATRAQQAAGGI